MSTALCLTMALVGANGCPTGYYSSSYYYSPYSYSYGTPYTYSYGTPYTYSYTSPYSYSYGTTYGSYGTAYGSPYASTYSPYDAGYAYQAPDAYYGYGYDSGYAAPGPGMYDRGEATGYRPPQPGYEAGRPQAQRGNVVVMTDRMRFEPALITINVGETVRWRNRSQMQHTVTADPNLAANPAHVVLPQGAQPVHSGPVQAGGEFSHTFQTPGTYYYVCLPHEEQGMVGIVVVRPQGQGGQNQGYEQQGAGSRPGGY